MPNSGVFPVYDNVFKIGTKGRASASPGDLVQIAEMESFSVSIDGGVEEWKPMEGRGWTNRMTTAKSLTISLAGKLCPSDPGNAYIAAWHGNPAPTATANSNGLSPTATSWRLIAS